MGPKIDSDKEKKPLYVVNWILLNNLIIPISFYFKMPLNNKAA